MKRANLLSFACVCGKNIKKSVFQEIIIADVSDLAQVLYYINHKHGNNQNLVAQWYACLTGDQEVSALLLGSNTIHPFIHSCWSLNIFLRSFSPFFQVKKAVVSY